MNNKKIFFDKLFPWKNGVNRNNLMVDYECVSYVTIPKDSDHISKSIVNKMKKYNNSPKDITIIDSTACIGGDSITFCNYFGIVIPIEIDEERYRQLIHNLNLYNLNNAYPVLGNCIDIIPDIQRKIDVVYIDPPWGGSDYKKKEKLKLKLGDNDLDQMIKYLLSNSIKLVVIKLPKNYDYDGLLIDLGSYNVTCDKSFKKIDVVFVENH